MATGNFSAILRKIDRHYSFRDNTAAMSALFATFRCYPVGESTLRRALGGVDTADLQRLTAAWAQAAGACNGDGGDRGRLPAVAIDPMRRVDHQSA